MFNGPECSPKTTELSTISLHWPNWKNSEVQLPDSKSWWNRYYLIRALAGQSLPKPGGYQADDVHQMYQALTGESDEINVGGAGTAFRFMTAFLALRAMRTGRAYRLDGNSQIRRRPISALVDALKYWGGHIQYLGNEGYPPLMILPARLNSRPLLWNNRESSQFVSALMMIAPYLAGGLQIRWNGSLVSGSYVEMTRELMKQAGADIQCGRNRMVIAEGQYAGELDIRPQGDWSSAAFWMSALMLRGCGSITFKGLHSGTQQGDEQLAGIYDRWGLQMTDTQMGTQVALFDRSLPGWIDLDLGEAPDLVPTVAATAVGLRLAGQIRGIGHVRLKESNRLSTLKTELGKWGATVEIGEDNLKWGAFTKPLEEIVHQTYGDHRIAMAFAPLAQIRNLRIAEPEVVAKSYPLFWEEGKKLGLVSSG